MLDIYAVRIQFRIGCYGILLRDLNHVLFCW